jgi:cyclopropane-fatty-acyl-phospholipid synthase
VNEGFIMMINKAISSGLVPDTLIRSGIQHFIKKRIKEDIGLTVKEREQKRVSFIEQMKKSPVAVETDLANDQHYCLPTEFFELVLGANLKYSCCHWDESNDLDSAEVEMLKITISRAEIKDGMKILELGCGWGAITLTMAKMFPNSEILAISNSPSQKDFILNKAKKLGLKNVSVEIHNVAKLELTQQFDRVISVEMFEHMRNYPVLLERISKWLTPEGKMFIHIFVHRDVPYLYEVKDESDWMSKYFFSGGIMPSSHLLHYFSDHLKVENYWAVDGEHYQKTARAWLENMDAKKEAIFNVLKNHYGPSEYKKWFQYWRIFFMSCEELWKYENGNQWFVGHYLLNKTNEV